MTKFLTVIMENRPIKGTGIRSCWTDWCECERFQGNYVVFLNVICIWFMFCNCLMSWQLKSWIIREECDRRVDANKTWINISTFIFLSKGLWQKGKWGTFTLDKIPIWGDESFMKWVRKSGITGDTRSHVPHGHQVTCFECPKKLLCKLEMAWCTVLLYFIH